MKTDPLVSQALDAFDTASRRMTAATVFRDLALRGQTEEAKLVRDQVLGRASEVDHDRLARVGEFLSIGRAYL